MHFSPGAPRCRRCPRQTLPKSAQCSRKGSSPLCSHDFSFLCFRVSHIPAWSQTHCVAKVSFASRVQGLQVWLTTPGFIQRKGLNSGLSASQVNTQAAELHPGLLYYCEKDKAWDMCCYPLVTQKPPVCRGHEPCRYFHLHSYPRLEGQRPSLPGSLTGKCRLLGNRSLALE